MSSEEGEMKFEEEPKIPTKWIILILALIIGYGTFHIMVMMQWMSKVAGGG